jgi:hypothetical protein
MAPRLNAEPYDDSFKPVGPGVGRSDTSGANGNPSGPSNEISVKRSSHQGTVVIRATVEHIGLAGDTEMTVTVKWPAATFCAQPCDQSSAQGSATPKSANVPPNGPAAKNFEPGVLYGSLDQDPAPAGGEAAEHSKEKVAATKVAVEGSSQPSDETGASSSTPPKP